jgi:uncharacterized cupredoxin-like copper-binding protein
MSRIWCAAAALLLSLAVSRASQGQSVEAITIRLTNFAFTPEQLHLRVGVPVRLHLVNDSSGGHSFSAPAFFGAGAYPSGAPPRDGTVEIAAGASVDITVVPHSAGTYKVECTHFLHSLFGMTGTIMVDS